MAKSSTFTEEEKAAMKEAAAERRTAAKRGTGSKKAEADKTSVLKAYDAKIIGGGPMMRGGGPGPQSSES